MRVKGHNKSKRKRGKKFVFLGGDQIEAEKLEAQAKQEINPFERKSKSKRIMKDLEVREGLVDEFKNRGRLSNFVDKRIGEGKAGLSHDDKMKLRYMKEQKDQLSGKSVMIGRRKAKFNIEDNSDEEELNFLTHNGKRLNMENIDDFKDNISQSDEDAYSDRDMAKGIMNEEMVDALHFGGGPLQSNNENSKKTREERHAEIMNKSKAYKFHKQEIKEATIDATKQLDDDLKDIAGLLQWDDKKFKQQDPKSKDDVYDKLMTSFKTEGFQRIESARPLNEKDKAVSKRQQLEQMQLANDQAKQDKTGADKEDSDIVKHDKDSYATAQATKSQLKQEFLAKQKVKKKKFI